MREVGIVCVFMCVFMCVCVCVCVCLCVVCVFVCSVCVFVCGVCVFVWCVCVCVVCVFLCVYVFVCGVCVFVWCLCLCVCVCVFCVVCVYVYVCVFVCMVERDSSVSIATRYGLEGPGSIAGKGEISAPVQTGPGAHPACCTMGTGSFPEEKRPGRGINQPSTYSAKVKERAQL